MIKPGSLVQINPDFYSITYNSISQKDCIGIVIQTEKYFYKSSVISHGSQDRHYILWGNETYSYEATNALIEFSSSDQ